MFPIDHTVPGEVANLFERVGEFDILANDIWGGDDLVEWGKKLWEAGWKKADDGFCAYWGKMPYGMPGDASTARS